jgi:hypothetical protein
MSKYDYIANNITFIKEGVMLGVISTSVLSHFRIYTQYINYLAIGYSVGKAVFTISEDNKISEIMIYKIKQSMEAEI